MNTAWSWRLNLYLHLGTLWVLYLYFRSLMNFELFWIICGRYRSNCIQYSVVCIWNSLGYPSIICWKDYSPQLNVTFVKNLFTIGIWVYLCTLHFILLIWMSDFMLLWSYFDYYSCIIYFEIEKCDSTNFILLFQDD